MEKKTYKFFLGMCLLALITSCGKKDDSTQTPTKLQPFEYEGIGDETIEYVEEKIEYEDVEEKSGNEDLEEKTIELNGLRDYEVGDRVDDRFIETSSSLEEGSLDIYTVVDLKEEVDQIEIELEEFDESSPVILVNLNLEIEEIVDIDDKKVCSNKKGKLKKCKKKKTKIVSSKNKFRYVIFKKNIK